MSVSSKYLVCVGGGMYMCAYVCVWKRKSSVTANNVIPLELDTISVSSKYLVCVGGGMYMCAYVCVWERKSSVTANNLVLPVYHPNISHVCVHVCKYV